MVTRWKIGDSSLDRRTLVRGGTRGVLLGADRQDDVPLVDDLVVLQIVQERGRRAVRIAGQEDRGAGHAVRRLGVEPGDEIAQRDLDAPRLLREDRRAASPGQHHQHQRAAEAGSASSRRAAIFRLFAARNVEAMKTNGPMRASAVQARQCQQ